MKLNKKKIKKLPVELVQNKKTRYVVYSAVFTLMAFYYSEIGAANVNISFLVAFYLIVVLGSIITQFPNIKLKNIIPIVFLPLHLAFGTLLSLKFFPNLGLPIRLVFVGGIGMISYMTLLTTNIFLVIGDREETIPLYRVALTWSQVLLVLVSIPYFAGVYKLPYIALAQNTITAISSFFFAIYLLWVLNFDRDVKKTSLGEKGFISIMLSYIVFISGISTSFFPAESFLRALFVSSVLLSCLGYIHSHYKNTITKKLVFEYTLMSLVFLIILFIFPA